MAFHIKYWSCSKFADKIRGTVKPSALEIQEWKKWHDMAKMAHPLRYWLAESAMNKIQDFITWPIRMIEDIKYYIINRWVTRTHALTSHSLKKGQYHEFDTRLLHSVFDELVNFVEVSLAWINNSKDVPFWQEPFWRSPELGVEYLKEMSSTDEHGDNHQQYYAELLELYEWWTKNRPNRIDPYISTGWHDFCEDHDIFNIFENSNPELNRQSREMVNKIEEIEKQYDDEDTEYLIRLIKIRNWIWV